jgi:uncharacterized protein (TIGR02001 family)
MKKVVLSAFAALAVTAAPAFAADMPVKAKTIVPVAAPSPWDVAFGTAFTTDYILRGVSQSNRKPAVQGYFEGRYNINEMIQLYAGVWGSSLNSNFADAEFDISGGARFTVGNFGLDLGYVYYVYPDGVATSNSGNFGEFYAKPSYKVTDWLTISGIIDGGNNFNDGRGIVGDATAYYYSGMVTVTPPIALPYGITTAISAEIGRQVLPGSLNADYTYWDAGIAFTYKAVTLDLRYWDTDLDGVCPGIGSPGTNLCGSAFVATLKFDTTLSALK